MDAVETPQSVIRIGIAHGPVQGFGEGDLPADIIAPDRDRRARLDYLALGDWHGALRISDRVVYSGAPERTGFGHDGRGTCHIVEIDAAGGTPKVEAIETGLLDWRNVTLDLVPGDDPLAMLEAALPEGARRDLLVRLVATGRVPLRDTSVLAGLERDDGTGAEFCHFEVNMAALGTEIEAADLDRISPGGALREAANALAAEAADAHLPEDRQRLADAALRRLNAVIAEVQG
jgi:DNA repair exonuclease SbcCD nuclease subunit